MNGPAMTPEQVQARVDSYRGGKSMGRAVVDFTREAVRDALHAAPQPVTRSWISYSTSCLGTLAARCEEQGMSSYRSRLDVLAGALLHGQNESAWPRAALSAIDITTPYDDEQAARIALWSTGLRPAARRNRVRDCVALTLGAGLRRRDMVLLREAAVFRDEHGVHVVVPAGTFDPGRTVTVTAAWEQEVLDVAQRAGSGLMLAPDADFLHVDSVMSGLHNANRLAPAGDEFSPTRARNTWLVRHVAAGTPLHLLMAQAGLTTTAVISDLLRFVPAVDPARAASFMRGGRA